MEYRLDAYYFFSLVLDFLVMYASFARNRQYKQEVVDTWKEN